MRFHLSARLTPPWLLRAAARLLCAAAALALPGFAQDAETLAADYRARLSALDRLRAEFDFSLYRASIGDDPFDPSKWYRGSDVEAPGSGIIRIARPNFQFQYRNETLAYKGTLKSWLNGRYISKYVDPNNEAHVLISRERRLVSGPLPILTPFELQSFDVQEAPIELLTAGALTVEARRGPVVILSGSPRLSTGEASAWRLRLELDTSRHCLPLQMSATLAVTNPDGSPRRIAWTMKTLSTLDVGGVPAIREAILAMDPGVPGVPWMIYHYLARSLVRDEGVTDASLNIEIPSRAVRLMDYTTGVSRMVNADGAVTHERLTTPQRMEAESREFAASLSQKIDSDRLQAGRRWWFAGIVAAAGAGALVVLGALLLRRRIRPRLAA